jgi:hypothetical protein
VPLGLICFSVVTLWYALHARARRGASHRARAVVYDEDRTPLRSTHEVESMISICRTRSANVKRWRDGQMALRWCAAGVVEAGKQFCRLNGHLHLRSLRDTPKNVTETVGAARNDEPSTSPDGDRVATEVPRSSGHPPRHRDLTCYGPAT